MKNIWTPEKIEKLIRLNKTYDLGWYKYYKSKNKIIAETMNMTYNQINSALRRFCKEGK
jgi:hypothetical protein